MVRMRDGRVGVRGGAVVMIGRRRCRIGMHVRHGPRAGDRQHGHADDDCQSPEHAHAVYEESSPGVKRGDLTVCRWRAHSSYPNKRRALAITIKVLPSCTSTARPMPKMPVVVATMSRAITPSER